MYDGFYGGSLRVIMFGRKENRMERKIGWKNIHVGPTIFCPLKSGKKSGRKTFYTHN